MVFSFVGLNLAGVLANKGTGVEVGAGGLFAALF